MWCKMKESLKRAYDNVLNTKDGQMVFEDLLSKFRIATGVYAFERNDNLADLAFRDGQRNAGLYIFGIISEINPEKASLINMNVFKADNEEIRKLNKVNENE